MPVLSDASLQAIADEYTNDPTGRGYAGASTPADKHALLVEAISQSPQVFDESVEISLPQIAKDIMLLPGGIQKWKDIETLSGNEVGGNHLGAVALVKFATFGLSGTYGQVKSIIVAMGPAGANILTSDDLIALQDKYRIEVFTTRAAEIGVPIVTLQDTVAALSL